MASRHNMCLQGVAKNMFCVFIAKTFLWKNCSLVLTQIWTACERNISLSGHAIPIAKSWSVLLKTALFCNNGDRNKTFSQFKNA